MGAISRRARAKRLLADDPGVGQTDVSTTSDKAVRRKESVA